MPVFISSKPSPTYQVQSGEYRWMTGPSGSSQKVAQSPTKVIRFIPVTHKDVDPYAIEFAFRHFNGIREVPKFGYEQRGGKDINIHRTATARPFLDAIAVGGQLGQGYDPLAHLGVFDTDDPEQCDPSDKTLFTKHLRENVLCGLEYVEVIAAKLQEPWPNYDQIENRGADKKIVALCEALGIPYEIPRGYEIVTENRAGVIKALDAAIKARDEAAAQAEKLTAEA